MNNTATQPWPKFTLVFSMFRTLSLVHLERSLYSLSKQAVKPAEMILFDNNSGFAEAQILGTLQRHFKVEDWTCYFVRHDGKGKTLSWANNRAIRLATYDTFIFVRADFIYDFRFCERMLLAYANTPMNYATSWMYRMPDIDLEQFQWRNNPQNLLANSRIPPEWASHIDGPTFCTSKQAMDAAGWHDEALIGWGFDQQDLQTQMVRRGVNMKVIQEYLYFHQHHEVGPEDRNLERATADWAKSPRRIPEILEAERKIRLEKLKVWKPAFTKIKRVATDLFTKIIKP